MMRIAVLYNDDRGLAHGASDDTTAVMGVVGCAEEIAAAVKSLGHEAMLVAAHRDPALLLEALRGTRAQLVFNLVESLDGEARLEAALASVLELAQFCYTGSPPFALTLALDKVATKAILRDRGIAVPQGAVLTHETDPLPATPFPWIIKPTREDASHGITKDSVVHDAATARARVRAVRAIYAQPVLVESFLPGRELNVTVLGEGASAQMLPAAEIDFTALPDGYPPLVTYEAKWVPQSIAYQATPSIAARALSAQSESKIQAAVVGAYQALGLRDYGRVDLRLDAQDNPYVLEVNPNPDLSPDAGLAKAARRAGLDYPELIAHIIKSALMRRHDKQ